MLVYNNLLPKILLTVLVANAFYKHNVLLAYFKEMLSKYLTTILKPIVYNKCSFELLQPKSSKHF